MTTRPAGAHTVRRHNRALVLAAVADSPGVSRAGVATRTGLTKATVSSLLDPLITGGLVTESGPEHRAGPGRRGTSLTLSPTGPHGLGVEIAVDYVATSLVGLTGAVADEQVRPAEHRGDPAADVLDRVADAVRTALAVAAGLGVDVGGVGVAVPGLVEASTGLLRRAPNLGWRDIDVPGALRERLDLSTREITVGNEANFAALAELGSQGADGDDGAARDFVHVSGEIGIGAGVVLGGELYDGVHGFGGELGHVPVASRGPRCSCGARGCLETYAGQEALLDRAGATDMDTLTARLDAADPTATAAVASAGRRLGTALSGVVNLLDVPVVVLGGVYARLYPWLVRPLRAELASRVLGAPWAPVEVRRSRRGTEAAVRGAASAAVRTILADPDTYLDG